jgi:hypothetical protein
MAMRLERLDGRIRDDEREPAFVQVEEALWDRGPAIVTAGIAKQVNGKKPPRDVEHPPISFLAAVRSQSRPRARCALTYSTCSDLSLR